MYTHTPFVTSGRLAVFFPQIAANASLSFFGAKRPFPAFFWAAAIFLPLAFAFVFLALVVVALEVVFVIAIEG